jgi:hypothetical protein
VVDFKGEAPYAMTALFAAALAGWAGLFLLVLAAAAARRAAPGAPPPAVPPPAVIGLLARGPALRLYQTTLLDLSGRGWFGLRQPGLTGPGDVSGPVMCELAARQPRDELTAYERRALTHVAFRTGARNEVPAPALSDGFQEGEDTFLAGFRGDVVADARARGLCEPRLRAGARALLCAAALVPAAASAAAVVAAHHRAGLWYVLLGFAAACAVVAAVGARDVPSRAGRAALARQRRAARERVGGEPGRAAAYAAALGVSAADLAIFGSPGRDETWSGFGGRWRPVTIGSPDETSPLGVGAIAYCVLMFPVLSVSAVLGFGGVVHGAGGYGLRACALAVAAGGLLLVSRAVARSSRLPSFAEFEGQVIRQWVIKGDDETPARHCVAVDDGTSTRAWALTVTAGQYPPLTPGTFVHVRVNPRRNRALSIQPTEPAPVAPRLSAVLADLRQADRDGLPDPALLVTEEDAAAVLGGPVRGTRLDVIGRLMIWRLAAASRPSLQVKVLGGTLGARLARQAERQGTPLGSAELGAADSWLLSGRSLVLRAGTLTVQVTLTGVSPTAADAALARLVPQVEGRLRAAASAPGAPSSNAGPAAAPNGDRQY